tara:strand:- start:50 stop:187 length:138 start_codon:yes stop_codon:yes gene_type:complete
LEYRQFAYLVRYFSNDLDGGGSSAYNAYSLISQVDLFMGPIVGMP